MAEHATGGGTDNWLGIVIGTMTRGRGRTDLDEQANVEVLPLSAAAGPCPRCGGALQDARAAGPLQAKIAVRMVECPSCGFAGLRQA